MPPDEKTLCEFVAKFVGWRPAEPDRYGPRWIAPNGGNYPEDGQHPPNFTRDLNAWHQWVAPVIETQNKSMPWLGALQDLCGKWIINWVNADAGTRCQALWNTLEGKLPEESENGKT